jgi:hypothetical protein
MRRPHAHQVIPIRMRPPLLWGQESLSCGVLAAWIGDQYEMHTNSAHYWASYYGRCFSDHPRPQICQHGLRTTGDLVHYIE